MTSLFPTDYERPKTTQGGYLKFESGLNSIRVLSEIKTGWIYFNTENKPVRSKTMYESKPMDISEKGKVRHFWVMVVWNNTLKKVQILEITQSTIMEALEALFNNPKWGDFRKYDLAITKTGEELETKYTVQGEPPIADTALEIVNQYTEMNINLEVIYTGGDPFTMQATPQATPQAPVDDNGLTVENIPF